MRCILSSVRCESYSYWDFFCEVTFSRIDPGGKLVIGYRKASNALESQVCCLNPFISVHLVVVMVLAFALILFKCQDPQTSSANPNGAASGDSCYPDATDSVSARNGHCGLQSMAGAKDSELSALPEQSNLVNGSTVWGKSEKLKGKGREDVVEQPKLPSDKKRMRNIKSKRLLMHNDDAMELRLTWEETQDLLRPPPNVKPNIIMVEDFEFEEYSVS